MPFVEDAARFNLELAAFVDLARQQLVVPERAGDLGGAVAGEIQRVRALAENRLA
jgi:hypothetical protein